MKNKVFEELKKVFYPGKTTSIVQENIIKDIIVENGKVTIKLQLKEDNQNIIDILKKSIPIAAKKVAGVADVELEIEKTKPKKSETLLKIRHIIATTSGKGGVGKTTVSVNTAIALAKLNLKVGLLDADIYGPNIPKMFGIENTSVMVDPNDKEKIMPIEKFGVKVVSIGNLVPEDAAVIWRGPLINQVIKQFLNDVSWGNLDFLIVDLPPGTGDAQLTLVQESHVTGGIIVITPQDVALSDAKKANDFFRKSKVPILGVIENMSYFICPNCGARTEIFSHGGGKKFAASESLKFLGEIPIDVETRQGADTGRPIGVLNPNSSVSKAFEDVARKIIEIIKILES